MSGKDQLNWDDDLDFESLADEHDAEMGLDDSVGKDADLEDLSYDAEPEGAEPAEKAEEAAAEPAAEVPDRKNGKAPVYRSRSGIPAAFLGFLFGFATIVSALGLGGAVLLLTGTDPRSLWQPEALMQTAPWLDLPNNPLNVLYLVGAGILLLALLIGWRVQTASRNANRNLRQTEEMLGKLLALRLGNQQAWQSPVFKSDPAAEAFVSEILGAWRLQAARQDKNVALEGELRRLEQAVASSERTEIGKGCEHPVVVRLAERIGVWFDSREAAENEVESVRSKDQHEAGSMISVIQDARSWNLQTLDQVGVQAAAVRRIGASLSEAAAEQPEQDESSRLSQVSLSLRELRTGMDDLAQAGPAAADTGSSPEVVTRLTELIDRGGKLAFQIAMEVASLGSRGERLLPMAQALEELTTEFRESAGQLQGVDQGVAPTGADSAKIQDMNRKLDGLIGLLDSLPAAVQSPWAARMPDLAEAAGKAAGELEQISGTFNGQAERLTGLGVSLAGLTGADFDPNDHGAGRADNPPSGQLDVSSSDPFVLDTAQPEPAAEIDPFAAGDIELPGESASDEEPGFSTDVTPGLETSFFNETPSISQEPGVADEPAAEAESIIEQDVDFAVEPEIPDAGMTVDTFGSEPALSQDEEKVYDLAEFGAERMDEPAAEAESEERIYDLAEFGAVGLD